MLARMWRKEPGALLGGCKLVHPGWSALKKTWKYTYLIWPSCTNSGYLFKEAQVNIIPKRVVHQRLLQHYPQKVSYGTNLNKCLPIETWISVCVCVCVCVCVRAKISSSKRTERCRKLMHFKDHVKQIKSITERHIICLLSFVVFRFYRNTQNHVYIYICRI